LQGSIEEVRVISSFKVKEVITLHSELLVLCYDKLSMNNLVMVPWWHVQRYMYSVHRYISDMN